jgi:hypothetical protein
VRHWLNGINKGKTDIFIENLPGGPDNINLAPDGSFWIALVQVIIILKAMFGLMVKDGMKWNGVVNNSIPLFGFVKNEWSGMKYDGTHSIPYHPILQISFPFNLGCMQ